MTRADVIAQRAKRNERKAEEARLCAGDFLLFADTVGEHAKRCVRPAGIVCSRDYDPGPPPEDEKLYEGTALATLWTDDPEEASPHAWQLAGWNITRQTGDMT